MICLAVSVARLAQEKIAPLVRKMDETSTLEPSVVQELFANGLMGIEVEGEYGGTESSFFTCMLAVEELAKIDPAVSAFCDIHQTLVNAPFRKHGTAEQKAKYLPRLAQDMVRSTINTESRSLTTRLYRTRLGASAIVLSFYVWHQNCVCHFYPRCPYMYEGQKRYSSLHRRH